MDNFDNLTKEQLIKEIVRLKSRVNKLEEIDVRRKESEEKYRIAFKTSPDAVNINRIDGLYVDINDGFTNLTGYNREDVIGKLSSEINIWMIPEDREKLLQGLHENGFVRNLESQFRCKDGSIKTALMSASLIQLENQPHILSITRDITDRKEVEKRYSDTHEQLLATLENMTDGFVSLDTNWVYTYINKRGAELFGRKPEDLIGKHIWTEFPEGVGQPFYKNYYKAMETQQPISMEDYYEPWGRWFENRIIPSPNGLSIFYQDITDRFKAEAKLKHSESRLKEAEKIAHLGYWELDIPGNVLYWSDEVYRIFGLEPQSFDATYEAFLEFIHPDDRNRVNQAYLNSLESKQPYDIIHRLVLKSGEIKWVHENCKTDYDMQGNALRSIGTVMDVTEIRKAEEALTQSNERFKTLFNDSPVPLWEEDFTGLVDYLNELEKTGITDFQAYFDTHDEELRKCARLVKIMDVNKAVIELYQASSKNDLLGNLDKTFTIRSFSVFKDTVIGLVRGLRSYETESEVKTIKGETRFIKLKIKIDSSHPDFHRAFLATTDITARKRAEEEVQQSKAYFQTIFDTATDAIFIHDGLTGKILDVNKQMCEMYGYEKEEVLLLKIEDFSEGVSPYSEKEALQWIQKSRKQQTSFEWRARHKDGHLFWVEVSISYTTIAGENRYIAVVRNIEDRKQAEAEIKKLSLVVHQNTAIVLITDTEGRITYVNRMFSQITGYSENEVLGKNPSILKSGDKDQEDYKQLWDAISSGKVWRGEFLNKKKNGELYYESAAIFPLRNEQGKIVSYVGIKEDITERKKAETALKYSYSRLEVLHTLDNAILESRSVVDMVNAVLQRLGQISPAKRLSIALFNEDFKWATIYSSGLLGKEIGGGVQVPSGSAFPEMDTLREGKVVELPNMALIQGMGDTLKKIVQSGIQSSFNIPIGKGDKLMGSINFGFEIPDAFTPDDVETGREIADTLAIAFEKMSLQKELEKYTNELEHRVAERTQDLLMANKELESFAYSVSHDLRAPLRAISGFSDIIVDTYQDSMDKDAIKMFQYIRESAINMSQLIHDLLKFSRMIQSTGKREAIDLKYLLEVVIRDLDKEIGEQQAVIEFPKSYPLLNSDKTLLKQICQNLIQNAITYHRPGVPPLIKLEIVEEDERLILSVSDNGIGIAKEHQQKIFEVFKRLHKQEEYPGTGIGLALVKKAVSKLGGHIRLESVPGEGTSFYIELPKG